MPKTAVLYNHPTLGDMYIDRGASVYELYEKKRWVELNQRLVELNSKLKSK